MKIVIALLLLASFSGCYTKSQLRKAVDEARLQACSEKDAEIAEKTTRLRRFNQINPDGSLR